MSESFDYVVLGGGSAGCVAAGELAQDPNVRVLVLEAGPAAEAHPETLSADGYKYAFANDAVMHERFTVPQRHSGDQRFFVGTGSVSGGSGSVNGMVYTRGAVQDYAQWPEGWRWADVVPDFEALERTLRPHRRPPTRWSEACISAAVANGFRRADDLNDGNLGNVIGYEWMTYEGDRRRSSYVAFVKDAARGNLVFRNGARVHRVVFDGRNHATAVEYEHEGEHKSVAVGREVLLAAGALETPKLLMLSGIGPGQGLRACGIVPRVEAPAVGQNLHDHPNVPLFFVSRGHVDCQYPQLYSFHRTRESADLPEGQSDTCYVFWPAPSAMKQAMQRMLPGKVLPPGLYDGPLKSAIRCGLDLAFGIGAVNKIVDHLYGIVVILGKPNSRGSVRLGGADPRTPAIVDPAYFSDPGDMQTMVDGIRLARRMSRSGGLGAWRSQELMPGPWNSSDEALARWVGKNAITTYHFAGTCKMGSSPSAPTDTRLRLRGVTGVRIADASAIPFTPVSALNAPSMLVGLRAARYAREDANEQVSSRR